MACKIEIDQAELMPIIKAAVTETIEQVAAERAKLADRLALTEPEAAALLGVKPHVLRDCRRRGELRGAKVGGRIVYTRAELVEFLERQGA
jgi:hypothetical protein